MKKGDKKIFDNIEILQRMLTMRNNGWTVTALARYFDCHHSSVIHQCNRHEIRPTSIRIDKAKLIRVENKKKIKELPEPNRTNQEISANVKEFKTNPVDYEGEKLFNKDYQQLLAEAEMRSVKNKKLKASDLFY